MYAIAFDLKTDNLKNNYAESYNKVNDEIRQELEPLGFEWAQGSVYINPDMENDLMNVYKAINRLARIEWFRQSVRGVHAFKVSDWSDFTDIVKC